MAISFPDSEWNIPQLDGMMGDDTDEDDSAIVHDDGAATSATEEEDEQHQIIMMGGGGGVGGDGMDNLVTEDHDGAEQPQQLDMSLEDLHHDLMDTSDQLIDQSIDGVDEDQQEHKAMLPKEHQQQQEVDEKDIKPEELKQEATDHHEGELLAAELLQQLRDQKAIIKEEEPTLADEADIAGGGGGVGGTVSDAGLLDTLAQAAALQKVVAVVAPQKKEKPAIVLNSNSLNNSVNKRRTDAEESSNNNSSSRNSANKWYTVGVIQGLTATVSHFYEWTCDEEGSTRSDRRRRSGVGKTEDGADGDKKRRLDVKNGSNGTAGGAEDELGLGLTDSDGEDTGVAMYNNQPLTLDNLPDLASVVGVRKMNLEPGTGYRFRIAAINNCGRGEWSEVSVEGGGSLVLTQLLIVCTLSHSLSPSRPVCLVSRAHRPPSRSQRVAMARISAGSRHHRRKARSSSTACTWR